MILDCPPVDRAQFAPNAVEARGGISADQPAQATVEDIRPSVPGHAQTARDRVGLQDLGLVAVHLQVAAAREPGDAATDDQNAHP